MVRSVFSAVMMLTYLCIHRLLDETMWTVSSSTGQSYDCGEVSFLSCDDVNFLCPHSLLDETMWTVSSSTGQSFDCGEVSFLSCDDVDLLVYPSSFG